MSKVAEKLTILLETGSGFLIRLYNTKIKYTPESKTRPAFLVDPVYAKVVAAFGKKFPEIPTDLDKVRPGFAITFIFDLALTSPPLRRPATKCS
jgi:hypothetical protein